LQRFFFSSQKKIFKCQTNFLSCWKIFGLKENSRWPEIWRKFLHEKFFHRFFWSQICQCWELAATNLGLSLAWCSQNFVVILLEYFHLRIFLRMMNKYLKRLRKNIYPKKMSLHSDESEWRGKDSTDFRHDEILLRG